LLAHLLDRAKLVAKSGEFRFGGLALLALGMERLLRDGPAFFLGFLALNGFNRRWCSLFLRQELAIGATRTILTTLLGGLLRRQLGRLGGRWPCSSSVKMPSM
jgi:hypothetical protein